jgi:hypothetical protein
MIVVSEVRCSDCLAEFGNAKRFHVLKEDKSRDYTDEERSMTAHLYPVLVCEACAGWYDDAVCACELESAP